MARGINKRGLFRTRFGWVRIEHMDCEVRVKRWNVNDAHKHDVGLGNVAYCRDMMRQGYVEIYCQPWISPPTAAHEAMHAVQFISRRKGIDMVGEMEHVAYLLDFILAKMLGYKPAADRVK